MSNFDNLNISQDCSIIIPVYRRYAIVKTILESLSNQKNVNNIKEIIICDSEKDDEDMNRVIERCQSFFKDNTIKHIFVENNISTKRNAGISKACSENIIFIDDDCVPAKDFVINHLKMLNLSPNTIFCGKVEFDEYYLNISNYIKYRCRRHTKYNLSNLPTEDSPDKVIDFTTIVTMNMSCKKQLLLDNNLFFDDSFLGYGMEDNEFGWRVNKCGILIKQCEATIIHNETGDFDSFCKKIYHVSRDGIPKFMSKHKEAVWLIPFSRYLEPEYPYHDKIAIFTSWILQNIIINRTALAIKYYLKITDGLNFIYLNFLYKYVLAYYYVRGAKTRNSQFSSNSETKDSFYINI